jgi:hypothetical protein
MSENGHEGEVDELARLRAQRGEESQGILRADRLKVYCGDSSHGPQRFSWTLYRDKSGVWRPISSRHKGLQFQRLNADTLFGYTGPDRWTYEFKCHWCKTTVPARGEKLTPVLDTVFHSGEPAISLACIRANL